MASALCPKRRSHASKSMTAMRFILAAIESCAAMQSKNGSKKTARKNFRAVFCSNRILSYQISEAWTLLPLQQQKTRAKKLRPRSGKVDVPSGTDASVTSISLMM